MTRENYLNFVHMGEVPDDLSGEELPPELEALEQLKHSAYDNR